MSRAVRALDYKPSFMKNNHLMTAERIDVDFDHSVMDMVRDFKPLRFKGDPRDSGSGSNGERDVVQRVEFLDDFDGTDIAILHLPSPTDFIGIEQMDHPSSRIGLTVHRQPGFRWQIAPDGPIFPQ